MTPDTTALKELLEKLEERALTHWSHRPLGHLESRSAGQRQVEPSSFDKPYAFWLSDETDEMSWSVWCSEEEFKRGSIRNNFLCDMSDVLHLSCKSDILHFTGEYGVESRFGSKSILWSRVGADFKGLLITPYVWEARLEVDWYYGWDCASAAIWDVTCLRRDPNSLIAEGGDRE